jgi:autoinducer 2 (AI-2) kinase
MREGIVVYDDHGAELWACPNADSRSLREAAELVADGTADQIFAEAGDWVSITAPARLRWLARNRPDVFERIGGIGMLSDWIASRLSGVLVTEPSCGSSSGMFSVAGRTWSQAIAKACGVGPDVLPPVVDPGTVLGPVTAAAAEQTGLRAGTPVVAGGADTQLGLLGAGVRVGEFAVLAGTFWQHAVLTAEPVIDPDRRLRTLCHVTPGQWMLEGIGFYSGLAMRWYRDAFCDSEVAVARQRGIDPYVLMEETAATIPPGSNGVIAVLSNLMTARRWVHASPSFLQFDLADPGRSGRAACIRAIEEAAAYVARGHLGIISELTSTSLPGLTISGGAAKGTLWPQIMADVLGLPVSVPAVTESSALGAALCAGKGAGVYASLTDLHGELRQRAATFEPGPRAVAVYNDRYPAWRQVYARMLDLSEEGLLRPLWRAAGT